MSFERFHTELCIPDATAANAAIRPDSPFYVYSDVSENLTTVTNQDFYLGSLRAAHHVCPSSDLQVTGEERRGEVVAIVANSSPLVYHTVTAGLLTAGCVPFPISARNSAAAIVNLLQSTKCRRVLATNSDLESLLHDVSKEIDVHIDEMPTFEDLYPRNKTIEAVPSYPRVHLTEPQSIIIYLHSSGSTGLPKPIPYTNKLLNGWKRILYHYSGQYATDNGRLSYGTFGVPPFHAAGFIFQLLFPLYYNLCIAIFPPFNVVPSPANVMDHIKRTRVGSTLAFPSLLTSWVENPDDVNYLRTLRVVFTTAGPLPEEVGDRLVEQGVNLRNAYGGTEFGGVTTIDETEKDWRYIKFHPDVKVRFVSQGNGTYEGQFLTSDDYGMAVTNLQDVEGFSTSDLWIKHPSKPGLWRLVGRIDDVVIHSNGEKTVPGPIEGIITSNMKISAAVMFGRARDRTGILIEPDNEIKSEDARQAFRDKVWPTVEKANRVSPAFSRIYKEMIIITSPLPRTPKGTVMRKIALQQYDDQIEKLYQEIEAHTQNVSLPRSWTKQDISNWLFDNASEITRGMVQSSTDDLFRQGFDSLGATFLRLRVQSALRLSNEENVKAAQQSISQNFVYDHPSIASITEFLISSLDSSGQSEGASRLKIEDIETAIGRFSSSITPLKTGSYTFQAPVHVLITGTTGNLGAALLRDLILDSRVRRIYAFNRPASGFTARDRQKLRFEDNGYDVDLVDANKLTLVETDTSKDGLGLESSLLKEIRENVNLIIHNAWRLNFNLGLSGFEDNIQSTTNLINLALSFPNPSSIRFLFCSSIAVSQSWDKSKGMYPEELQMDPSYAQGGGYGEAKYVCERLVFHSGLNSASFRIGQIAGGKPNGSWNVTDWVPLLLRSSLSLGCLPSSKGLLSWIPCDAVASTILDVAFTSKEIPSGLNIIHPHAIPWNTTMDFMVSNLRQRGMHGARQLLPFPKWFERLSQVANSPTKTDLDNIPAIKLLEFYRGLTIGDEGVTENEEAGGLGNLATEKTQVLSHTLRELPSLTQEDVNCWVEYWVSKGLFN